MLKLRNFRYKIIVTISLIFIIFWSGGIAFFSFSLISDSKKSQILQANLDKTIIVNKIKDLKEDSSKILTRMKELLSEQKVNEEEVKKIWNKYISKESFMKLGYYDSNNQFSDLSGTQGFFNKAKGLPDDIIKRNKFYINGISFFSCAELCQLYSLSLASEFNFDGGMLQISISVDTIMDEILKSITNTDIIVLRKSDDIERKDIEINKIGYQIEVSSSIMIFDSIKDMTLNDLGSDFAFVSNEKSSYLLFFIKEYRSDGVLFVMIKNLYDANEKLNDVLWGLIKFSLLILLVVIALLNYLINKSMLRVKNLSDILMILGDGSFSNAKLALKKTIRKKIYDELDLIYSTTHQLISQLESTHIRLKESNNSLTATLREVRFLAEHDTLTGLLNRRRFSEELQRVYEKRQPFSLISADLNHFKLINDSLGHAKGDELLIQFSEILTVIIDKKGIIGRVGGDEFSIIILSNDKETIEKLLTCIADKTKSITFDKDAIFRVSVSLGVARFPDDTENIYELSSFSDAAMYENKRYKRDAVNFYTGEETIIKKEKEYEHWSRIIGESLISESIVVMFQPIMFKNCQHVFAYEVLSRIKYNNEIYFPNDFIAYAERNNSIIQLDRLVLTKALAKARDSGFLPTLSINFSYITIASVGIVEYIIKSVRFYDYPPKKIIFEITETMEIDNFSIVKYFINELKKYGFLFALDDFGSGASSFHYLTELGIDILKIDKNLILDLHSRLTDQYVVESIILLAEKMKINIIAEGVENIELLNTINEYNIDYLQGYYFSYPTENFTFVLPNPSFAS